MNQSRLHNLIIKLAITTLVFTYLVILAGSVVRATGSGMGCPDWPKCFGHLIPPTDSSSLEKGYQQIYVEKRKTKNERMARVLRFFGAEELAEKILGDPNIYKELDFNPTKAWIEYVNRLFGVLLGLAQFALVLAAAFYRRTNRTIFWFSLLALLLTVLEGWLGSLVVSTNLLPGTITIHMFLALGILALMTGILVRLGNEEHQGENKFPLVKNVLRLAVFISLVQIYMGTQVREQVDDISMRIDNRSLWMTELGAWFEIHRILALLVLLLNGYLFYYLKKAPAGLKRSVNWLVLIIVAEITAGISLSYFSLPAFVQPLHLMLAVFMFGVQVQLLMRVKRIPH
jgi:cytochrome c oxidase assembly protein subunit 15